MNKIIVAALSLLAFFLGYILTDIWSTIAMNKIGGYDASLNHMVRKIREKIDNGVMDVSVARDAIFMNLRIRVFFIFVLYIPIIGILFSVWAGLHGNLYGWIVLAGNIGVIISGYIAISCEYSFYPKIVIYEGIDREESKIYFKKLITIERAGDEYNEEFVFEYDSGEVSEEIADLGDILVVLEPPTGDIIYDTLA